MYENNFFHDYNINTIFTLYVYVPSKIIHHSKTFPKTWQQIQIVLHIFSDL